MHITASALLALVLASAAVCTLAVGIVDGDDVENPVQADTVSMTMLLPAVKIPPELQLVGFSWNDCGGAGAWVKIKTVSVLPDPVHLDGKITVFFSFIASHSFGDGQPLATSVVLKKRFLGTWITLPCIGNVGSCNYGDLCTAFKPPATCPPDFVKAGVPCKCPFPAGNFTLPGYTFTVDASKIPSFLESGSYQASVNVNAAGSQVLCASAELSLA